MLRALSASLVLAVCACQQQETPASGAVARSVDSDVTAFEHVTVIPMTGTGERRFSDQSVVVRGDRIVAVGAAGAVDVPRGASVVDGRGKFLAPGLAEMHGHVPPPSAPPALTEQVLFLYLANGITTVRGMLGADGQLELRERANRGELLSPTLYLAGPSFRDQTVSSPAQAAQMVREQMAEGWNLLKIHPGLTRAEYDSMALTAAAEGIRFGGHVPAAVGIEHAIEMGQETFDHIDGYTVALDADEGPVDERALADLVRKTRDAGAWIVPTMALWEAIYGTLPVEVMRAYPELEYVPAAMVRQWEAYIRRGTSGPGYDPIAAQNLIDNRVHILRALHKGGVRILMGTDAPQAFSVPGFSLHREFPRMAEAGMSPYEILESGTAHVGTYFANEDSFGTVAEGMRADLLLLDADPLEDAANLKQIAGVMVRGRWVPQSELHERLEAIRAEHWR